jgi:hypothetical protein
MIKIYKSKLKGLNLKYQNNIKDHNIFSRARKRNDGEKRITDK